VLLVFGLFLVWVFLFCFAEPPELDARPAALDWKTETSADGRVHLGPAWFERREGRSLLYLEGAPFAIGYANAHLTAEFLEIQERSLMETVEEHFPSLLGRLALGLLVLVNDRNLADYVAPEYQLEILGLSEGRQEDPYPYMGPRYNRVLNYHAAHDISHWVWDAPVLGCSAFAARGSYTRSGTLLVGRNFDWEAGAHFDRNKVIVLCRPEEGLAFLSVSWPGMAGVVTGMNEERLYCSVNGAHSERRSNIGQPVSLVVRQVLQYARDLPQAIAIIREAPVFVADSYLLADGEAGEAVVVEKAPGLASVRAMDGDVLIQANHFESEAFAADEGNREYMREGTSLARRARLGELLEEHRGALDVASAVGILRDKKGPGGAERSPGHRATINPMIATHSVVADVSAGILWVSRGPHQLGAFDAYRISDFGAPAGASTEADADLANGNFERLEEERRVLRELAPVLDEGAVLNEGQLERLAYAETLNPSDPIVLLCLARAAEAAGEKTSALTYFEAALAATPPFPSQAREAEAALARLRKNKK
jgi:tetratricopeptide (TPR) repeat protein